ncbi:hypothetical protein ACFLZX_05340 [Nanoarchaeota archaeon]
MSVTIYYYEDIVTNAIVELLKKQGFKHFQPLTDNDIILTHEKKYGFPIEDESAVLLWGDGYYHQVSFHFSPNKRYSKVLYDAHDDFAIYVDNSEFSLANHNTFLIEKDPLVDTIDVLGSNMKTSFEYVDESQQFTRTFNSTPSLVIPFENRHTHCSVDLDVIRGYPCNPRFKSCAQRSSTEENVTQSLDQLFDNNDVSRLDIGGLGFTHVYKGKKRKIRKGTEVIAHIVHQYINNRTQ